MLLVHFTLSETTDNVAVEPGEGFVAPGMEAMAQTEIEMAMEAAQKAMYTELCGFYRVSDGIEPYNRDGGRPFTFTYVGQWQVGGGLDCATEWCERYKGMGVHVGLVIEGKPSGPLYGGVNPDGSPIIGVRDGDFDRVVVDTFAKHLAIEVARSVVGFEVDGEYSLTDWALYERQSLVYPMPGVTA